jgi:hypothetical protein
VFHLLLLLLGFYSCFLHLLLNYLVTCKDSKRHLSVCGPCGVSVILEVKKNHSTGLSDCLREGKG